MENPLEKSLEDLTAEEAWKFLQMILHCEEPAINHYTMMDSGPQLIVDLASKCKEIVITDEEVLKWKNILEKKAEVGDYEYMGMFGSRILINIKIGMAIALNENLKLAFKIVFAKEEERLKALKAGLYGPPVPISAEVRQQLSEISLLVQASRQAKD